MNVVRSVSHREDYDRARRALTRLGSLPPDWDDEGAPGISKAALDRAVKTVNLLEQDGIVPAPKVAAMPDGGVELAWATPTRRGRLEIEARLNDDGDILMVGYAHEAGFEVEDRMQDPQEIAQRVRDQFKQNTR